MKTKENFTWNIERSTLGILFYLRNDKSIDAKNVPIYLRITVNGERTDLSTQRSIDPSKWNSKGGKAKGNNEQAKRLNNYLDVLKNSIYDAQTELIADKEPVTAISLRNLIQGKSKKQYKLIEVFEYHNIQLAREIPTKNYASATLKRYDTTLKHIREFLVYSYGLDDIYLNKLNHEFVGSLEHYFKTVRKCNHNSTMKYIKNLKKVVNLAYKNEWIRKDPFTGFTTKLKPVKREYLTEDELLKIENLALPISRLDTVRDIFIFSCYTGFAYVDVESLTWDNVRKGIDGDNWIFTERTKTSTKSNVPILPPVEKILNKYRNHPEAINRSKLLPVISNQRTNAYLKEIADLAGIDKRMTFHLARHTFATYMLTNDVPIESVSEMLGHKNIRTTQIYAKVIDKKVSNDMSKIKAKLKEKSLNQKII